MVEQEFINYLALQELKPRSVESIVTLVKIIDKNCLRFDRKCIESFIAKKKLAGASNNYLGLIVNAAKHYTLFLKANHKKHDKSIIEIKTPKRNTTYERGTLSDKEIEALLSLPPNVHTQILAGREVTIVASKKSHEVWTMLFAIMAFSGMRVSEAAELTVDDVDFGRSVFIVRNGKTGSRLVPIAPNLDKKLYDYIDNLETKKLFPKFHKRTYIYAFQRRIERLGIKRACITPYSLRHSFITSLLNEDVNLFKVQKIVGHKKAETTLRYTHFTTKDIQQAIQKHPLIRKSLDPKMKLDALREIVNGMDFKNDSSFSVSEENGKKFYRLSIRVSV